MRDIPANQTYPEMTGLGIFLYYSRLQIIPMGTWYYWKALQKTRQNPQNVKERHFRKHFHHPTSIHSLIKRLNLEYALIKIYLFRIKLIIKEMPSFIEQ